MTGRLRIQIVIVAVAAAASWAVYFYGAFNSPFLNPELAARQAYLDRIIDTSDTELATGHLLAEAYWNRNPDVASDRYFGRDGSMGVFGAREHHSRHGKREGRVWGEAPR